MEKKLTKVAKKQDNGSEGKKITRKQAIKKTGYMAVSAATMMILLNKNAKGQNGPPMSPPNDAGNSQNSDDAVGTYNPGGASDNH